MVGFDFKDKVHTGYLGDFRKCDELFKSRLATQSEVAWNISMEGFAEKCLDEFYAIQYLGIEFSKLLGRHPKFNVTLRSDL